MKTGEMMISVAELTPCPWNPRGEITPESVADLTASIKARGLLQNIGVWKRPDADGYYVIFGNRRYVACVNAMMATVPCRVFDCSEVEAHEITRIENEARLGVSPIEDARLVGKMIDLGYSGKEIAAHFGVSEAHITRRRKLLDLSPAWASRALEVDIPTDMLEHVSAYSREIQDKVLSKVSNWNIRAGWKDCERFFREVTADLDHCPFVMNREDLAARCRACPKRTGATPDLFDGLPDGGLGSCMDAKCFKKMRSAYRQQIIEDNVPGTVTETVVVNYRYDFDYRNDLVKKPCEGKDAAYVYVDEEKGKAIVKYGPSKAAQKEAEAKKKKADAAQAAEAKKREKVLSAAKNKIKKWWTDANIKAETMRAVADGCGVIDGWGVVALWLSLRIALPWDKRPSVAKIRAGLIDSVAKAADAFVFWWKVMGREVTRKFAGYVDSTAALEAETFYPDLMKDLTPEERAAIEQDAKERR